MSRINPYASIEKRTFQAALIHLLETEYRIVGSHRILKVLAEDVEALVEEFYPKTERAQSGQLVWTCTGDEGQKAQPGKPTEAYKTATVILPLIGQEELHEHTLPCGRERGRARLHERQKRQVQRMVMAAHEQGGLLTLAEVSVILGAGYEKVRQYVQEIEAETGKPLPLKGYKMDQGSRPTHKGEVIRLYEQGMSPPDIARETNHNLKSVERYLKDYERVRMLLKQDLSAEAISAIIGRGKSVVEEYIAQARTYHPELFQATDEES
jgi:DNA-binding CsgD family transcriptional regulator